MLQIGVQPNSKEKEKKKKIKNNPPRISIHFYVFNNTPCIWYNQGNVMRDRDFVSRVTISF